MLRSAFGAFIIVTLASLGFVSFMKREQASHGASAAPIQAPARASTATAVAPLAQSVAAGVPDETVIAADRQGHFFTEVEIDGRMVHAVVDTGASAVALTSEDAVALGLRPPKSDFRIRVSTANGSTSVAPVHLRQIRIGNVWIYNIDAFVSQPGVLSQTLLGMSALRKLRNFEFSGNRLVLTQ